MYGTAVTLGNRFDSAFGNQTLAFGYRRHYRFTLATPGLLGSLDATQPMTVGVDGSKTQFVCWSQQIDAKLSTVTQYIALRHAHCAKNATCVILIPNTMAPIRFFKIIMVTVKNPQFSLVIAS